MQIFKFQEGERVALKRDMVVVGLKAGTTGIIWALYDIEPPAYDITVTAENGKPFDMLVYEEELEKIEEPT